MYAFDIAALLLAVAAICGYINHRVLRLPATTGTLLVALVASLVVLVAESVVPAWRVTPALTRFLGGIDFNATLMHGMLCFLLFAGALHLDLDDLRDNKWTIGVLSTVSVILSTLIVGMVTWWVSSALQLHIAWLACLVFGALISPTDPIAVMGMLKALKAPPALEAQIAGESLFNDGIAVVAFFGIVSLAGLSGATDPRVVSAPGLVLFFLREVGGGVALGLGLGYVAYRALKRLDDPPLELLITLALVMFMYSLSFWIHVSGPIAVVVAGLLIGNPGRTRAMTAKTREHVDAFWQMMDEILNAVLFLLLGLQVFALPTSAGVLTMALVAIPMVLAARWLSVAVPVSLMSLRTRYMRGIVPILTWSGLRGGISVAMMLSLPEFSGRDSILASTYAVVVFSILAQGLTVRRLLARYEVGVSPGRNTSSF